MKTRISSFLVLLAVVVLSGCGGGGGGGDSAAPANPPAPAAVSIECADVGNTDQSVHCSNPSHSLAGALTTNQEPVGVDADGFPIIDIGDVSRSTGFVWTDVLISNTTADVFQGTAFVVLHMDCDGGPTSNFPGVVNNLNMAAGSEQPFRVGIQCSSADLGQHDAVFTVLNQDNTVRDRVTALYRIIE